MNRRKNPGMVMGVCVFLAVLAAPAAARTIYVDPNGSADFSSIQPAIDNANHDDHIVVAPGTYNEAINLSGKRITLRSTDPNNPNVVAATVISASGLGSSVVTCNNSEEPGTILAGFTITGGNATNGGGMYCENSDPTVTNCTFSSNTATTDGGGMYCKNSSPAVTNCTFAVNTANCGAGMYNRENSSPTVTNCTFTGNSATGYHGGGMYCDHSIPTVTNCTFYSNTTTDNGGGIGFHYDDAPDSAPNVTNCLFIGNTAGNNGGGISNGYGKPTVTNCTFSGNSAGGGGGGINNYAGRPPVTNCILWGDTPDEISDAGGGDSSVTYCDVQGGYSGTGNIGGDVSDNPLFVDADSGDLRLRACSPCVDAGNNAATGLTATDLGGEPRKVDDEGVEDTGFGTAPIVDMGAYERQENTLPDPVYNVTQDANYCSIQAAIDDAHNGNIIEVGPGTYGPIDFRDLNITVYSTHGASLTFIDAGGYGTAVTCKGGQDTSTVLEGFTITGGNATNGGGMYCEYSDPTVTNCTFSSNTATTDGGGMYCKNSSPVVTNCTFAVNTANCGAGMYNRENSSPTVTNCTFTGNTATGYHGGGMYCDHSIPTVTNCTFYSNYADEDGGGIGFDYNNAEDSAPNVTNCLFIGNTAGSNGGGISNGYGKPTVTNCTFVGNSAGGVGGGINNYAGQPTVTNCILWGDTPDEISDAGGGDSIVTYCDVQGGYSGTGNINANPWFVSRAADDLRLRACSPCVDAGNNAAPGLTATDLGGDPRKVDDAGVDDTGFGTAPIVDMGAYERQQDTLLFNVRNITQDVNYCSIQSAIDDAHDGEVIEVGPGTYNPIDFGYVNITVRSTDGPSVTFIDAGGYGTAVTCKNGQGPSTVLEGFTITGGNATNGGGMYCENSDPTVTNCTFSSNTATTDGGGMYCKNSSPAVTNCTFAVNTANCGAGMYNKMESSPTVTNCTFTGNTATGWHGGGMYCDHSIPTVTNCTFYSNTTTDNGGGIGFDYHTAEDSAPNVTNCLFIGNTADNSGGGISNGYGKPTVTNCTFSGNSAGGGGGGINNYAGRPTVTNCILWGDTPDEISDAGGGDSIVTYSDVQGGTGQSWFGTGCIDADPRFVNPARFDLRLVSYGSPCVDAGNNSVVTEPNDLPGNPRVVDGDEDGTATVDMGAYEYGEYRVHNVTQDVSYITIAGAIRDANNRDDEIEVSPGTYPGGINFNGKAIRLYSSGGPQVTTIDGEGAYHVVKCVNSEGPNTIIEGFTITGGDANGPDPNDRRGGGMYCENGSPMVSNCTFRSNSAALWGGGMYCRNSSPTVTNCTFSGNSADSGGGGMLNLNSSPTVTNCTFSGNSIHDGGGGGMNNYDNSGPTVTDCTFSGNSAGSGGGICNNVSSSPTVTNCTFTVNTATAGGGAMYNGGSSSPTVTNCIFWADTAPTAPEISGSATVTYSDVQGGWGGEGNIDANPIFRNVDKGNLSLVPWSPCIDAGNNDVVPPGAADIAGLARLVDGDCDGTVTVDMGAHELQHTYMSDFDSTCLVNWADFAVLAWAWLAEPLSENWDPACDISIPADGSIDYNDLKVLAENWLDHADTSITCDAAVLNHVFGLDPVTIFDILGAAPCSFSPDQIIEQMKQGGCPMLQLVEIDADESGEPVIPDGFHALGSYSFTTAGCQFAARELLPGTLASPVDYVQVCATDYWKPVAPTGYVCLGLVENSVKPGLDDVKCVKEQLAGPGTFGVKVDPPKADDPNHIIPADTNGVYIGTFGLSDCPQSLPLYVLDARIVQKPEYLTLQDIDQLIQDYGPVLKLYPGEDYLPDDPQWVLDNGVRLEWALVENESDYDTFTQTYVDSMPTSSATLTDDVEYVLNTIKPNPPYNSSESFKYWLNIPDALKPGNLSRAKCIVRVVPWNHFFTEIQFWFFYPFNGPTRVAICPDGLPNTYEHALRAGRHYGDWEHVTLRFLNNSKELVSVYMSAHDEGHWFDAGDFGDTLQFLGLHPIVYSGKYSHAQYSTTGLHYYDITPGSAFGVYFEVRLYDLTRNGFPFPTYLADKYCVVSYDVYPVPAPDWLGFTGRWGQYEKVSERFCYSFPLGVNCRTDKRVQSGPASLPVRKAWQVGISQEALTTE